MTRMSDEEFDAMGKGRLSDLEYIAYSEAKRARTAETLFAYYLKVFVRAHRHGNSVPPYLAQEAGKAVGTEGKP